MTRVLRFLCCCLLPVSAGCSPTPASVAADAAAQADADSGAADTGAADSGAPDVSQACNTLTLDGVEAGKVHGVAGAAPPASGGTIVEGSYRLAEGVIYDISGFPDTPDRTRLEVKGGTFQFVHELPDATLAASAYTYAVAGNALTLTRTCPAPAKVSNVGYSVGSAGGKTTLTVFGTSGGKTLASVYALL